MKTLRRLHPTSSGPPLATALKAGFLLVLWGLAAVALSASPKAQPILPIVDVCILSSLVIIALVALNGAYIAAETAVDLLRSTHVKHVREESGRRSERLQDLIDRRIKYVTACLLASRAARLGLFLDVLVSAPSIAQAFQGPRAELTFQEVVPWTVAIGVPVLLLNLFVGELVPRSYAALHPHRVGLGLYNLIRLAAFVLSIPAGLIIALASLVTARFGGRAAFESGSVAEEEIKSLVESAEETGEIESDERELIHSVLEFNDTVAREIMTPRVDLDAAPVKSTPEELIEIIRMTGHSRIPLYEETDDQIVGIIHAKDLLLALATGKRPDVRRLLRPPLFVPEGKSIHELLSEMRADRSQMAIIQDEFGGTAGIVTTEDIVEQLVGDIVDEYDEEEASLVQEANAWHVSGKTPYDDVNDAIGSEFKSEEFDTIGGLVFGHFGRQPRVGESILIDDYVFTVEETDGRKIIRLKIEPAGSEGLANSELA
jgi:putative hemolysin